MYVYEFKYDRNRVDGDPYFPIYVRHSKRFPDDLLKNLIDIIRFEMDNDVYFRYLKSYLKGHGFIEDDGGYYEEVITAYFEN